MERGRFRLDNEFLEKLKLENPIAEIMRENGVDLKTAGHGYMCKCPFHDDSTASCSVVPSRGYFHCFGCGAAGDVIAFVRKQRTLSFMDAVNYLAQRAGMTVPSYSNGSEKSYKRRMFLYEMNKNAAKFFRSQLKTQEGLRCLDYLVNKRKLSAEVIKKYGMGFAPKSFSALKIHMLGLGYSEDDLLSASLIMRSAKNGNTYDFFVDRAMFPFIDISGNIVGFGGRTLGDDKRKYLNTSDTTSEEYRRSGDEKKLDGYSKSRFVFSLNYAKDEAARSRQVLLCEGNLDVISLYQHGFTNAVASCGTALTPEQVKAIKNYADKVVICYDSDAPGQKAALKAVGLLRAGGLGSSVIHMDRAKDPDEYINKFGEEHFSYLIKNAKDGFDFELDCYKKGLDLSNRDDKRAFMDMAYNSVASEPDPTSRDIMEHQLSEDYSVSLEVVKNGVQLAANKLKQYEEKAERNEQYRHQYSGVEENVPDNKAFKAERGLIYYIYKNSDMANEVSKKIEPDEFTDDFNRRLYISLLGKINAGDVITPDCFTDEFDEYEMTKVNAFFRKYAALNVDSNVAADYIKSIKDYNIKNTKNSDEQITSDEDMFAKIEELRRRKNNI